MKWATIPEQEFYTLAEVGKILRMSKKHVYQRLIRRKVREAGRVRYVTRLRHHQDGPGAEITVWHADLVAYVRSTAVEVDAELEGKKP